MSSCFPDTIFEYPQLYIFLGFGYRISRRPRQKICWCCHPFFMETHLKGVTKLSLKYPPFCPKWDAWASTVRSCYYTVSNNLFLPKLEDPSRFKEYSRWFWWLKFCCKVRCYFFAPSGLLKPIIHKLSYCCSPSCVPSYSRDDIFDFS